MPPSSALEKMEKITIALTGGMGCGKSQAAAAFAQFGLCVLDADKLAREALECDPRARAVVGEVAGEEAFKDGRVDRKFVAQKVFADARKLARLESVVHPIVAEMWRKRTENARIAVVEVPLLFEKKLEKEFDLCVSVYCGERVRARRLELRGMSPSEMAQRDAFQMSPAQKANLADIVIFNETSVDFLKVQVARIVLRLNK